MTVPRPHIASMAPYSLARLAPPDGIPLISLSQNESLRPPSPKAVEAAAAALNNGMLYPDPDWSELREELGQRHGVNPNGVLCGNGSLDLIGCIARVFSGPGRSVLAPAHAYPFFRSAAQMSGARFDIAPERGTTVSIDTLLNGVAPNTGVVFLANPGNPTGTRIPQAELRRLRDNLRQDILLVVDEAYGEFADHLNETNFDMVQEGNTVVLRTFSKAYGMAGFRLGWGLFPEPIAAELRKVMNPNNISAAAQAAAVAAVLDHDYMRETCRITAALRDDAATALTKAGFSLTDSFTNFLLIDMGDPESAQQADEAMRDKGIFLRPQGGAGLPHMLRMTIGAEHDNKTAISSLIKWKTETR